MSARRFKQCGRCQSTGWVCEEHTDKPWRDQRAGGYPSGSDCCGGAGMPCPDCNKTSPDRLPHVPGLVPTAIAEGWD